MPMLATPSVARRLPALLVCAAVIIGCTGQLQAGELTGCWQGCWDNWHDMFKGRIKARIWKCDDMHYQMEVSGIALVVVPYRYRTTLTVTHVEGDRTYFEAYDKLPIWGRYWMTGYVCGDQFVADYSKCNGGGCWTMCRTCTCPNCCCR